MANISIMMKKSRKSKAKVSFLSSKEVSLFFRRKPRPISRI